LESVEKQTGKTPEDLIPPTEFPMVLTYIWSTFLDLHQCRSYGMSANPLSYTDILNYMEVTGKHLSLYEIETIKKLDIAYLGSSNGS